MKHAFFTLLRFMNYRHRLWYAGGVVAALLGVLSQEPAGLTLGLVVALWGSPRASGGARCRTRPRSWSRSPPTRRRSAPA